MHGCCQQFRGHKLRSWNRTAQLRLHNRKMAHSTGSLPHHVHRGRFQHLSTTHPEQAQQNHIRVELAFIRYMFGHNSRHKRPQTISELRLQRLSELHWLERTVCDLSRTVAISIRHVLLRRACAHDGRDQKRPQAGSPRYHHVCVHWLFHRLHLAHRTLLLHRRPRSNWCDCHGCACD